MPGTPTRVGRILYISGSVGRSVSLTGVQAGRSTDRPNAANFLLLISLPGRFFRTFHAHFFPAASRGEGVNDSTTGPLDRLGRRDAAGQTLYIYMLHGPE